MWWYLMTPDEKKSTGPSFWSNTRRDKSMGAQAYELTEREKIIRELTTTE